MIRGSPQALDVQDHLEAGSKHPELHGCRKFHDLEGPAHGVRYYKEEWSRYLLFKLIEAQNPPRVMRFGAENINALTQRIPFE